MVGVFFPEKRHNKILLEEGRSTMKPFSLFWVLCSVLCPYIHGGCLLICPVITYYIGLFQLQTANDCTGTGWGYIGQ